MGAVVSCSLGNQADKLADEYLGLAEKKVSAVVVSQTWAEVYRVNEQSTGQIQSKRFDWGNRRNRSNTGEA